MKNFNVLKDAILQIEMTGVPDGSNEVRRTCLGTSQHVIAMVVAAMQLQPEIKEVLFAAVDLVREHPNIAR